MKKIILAIVCVISSNLMLYAYDDVIKAMKDEMQRSLKELKIENLDKPYFIEYILTINDNNNVAAQFGSLKSNNSSKKANLTVKMRVGDYSFDNTNFIDFTSSFYRFASEDGGYSNVPIPLDYDYNSLRRTLWLASDAAYKNAIEVLSKKQAAIKNKVINDTTADFSRMKPVQFVDTMQSISYNHDKYIELCKYLSKQLSNPEVYSSLISFEYNKERVIYLNSEGTQYVKDISNSGIEMSTFSQCDDGMPVMNFYSAYSLNPNNLPTQDSLEKASKNIISKLTELVKAPKIEDAYSGPILFTSQAAGEIFSQVFIPNFVAQRPLITMMGKQKMSEKLLFFQNKIGGRVLPEFLSVNSIPTEEKIDNEYLFGYYKYDDEGVKAQKLELVKNGYLKTLLTSRVPIKRIQESNGNMRNGGAIPSNIQMLSAKSHSKSYQQLKEKMISLCKDRDLPYGIVVKKIVNRNIFYTGIMQIANRMFSIEYNKLTPPIEVYKVFPNGKEELIRGGELGSLSPQSFKDIILVGNKNNIYNFLMYNVVDDGSFNPSISTVSVIVPDMLFEDAEIKPNEDDFPKLPFISQP